MDSEKEQLLKEFLEIHRKLGDSTIPFQIRGLKEKRKQELIKLYQKKFGRHIASDL